MLYRFKKKKSVIKNIEQDNFIKYFPVQGEDDAHEVTVGSFVTLKVKLKRTHLLDPNRRLEEIQEVIKSNYA